MIDSDKTYEIVNGNKNDVGWIMNIFAQNRKIFGNELWFRSSLQSKHSRLIVIREIAFLHYKVDKTGMKIVGEIAVDLKYKRQGIAKGLFEALGRPVQLKTDSSNKESNAFYRSIGLSLCGVVRSRNGKTMNVWQGW